MTYDIITTVSAVGDHRPEYHIDETHYRDIYGNLLFTEPMVFKKLWGVGDDFIHEYERYVVQRVAIADNVQHVNITKGG